MPEIEEATCLGCDTGCPACDAAIVRLLEGLASVRVVIQDAENIVFEALPNPPSFTIERHLAVWRPGNREWSCTRTWSDGVPCATTAEVPVFGECSRAVARIPVP